MTMHVSKGLEFPVVAVMGLGEASKKQDEVEAEARLLYVAATRAKQRLFIAKPVAGLVAQACQTNTIKKKDLLEVQPASGRTEELQ